MKNRNLQLQPYLSAEELYALEREARVARSAEVARLLAAGFAALKRLVAHPVSTPTAPTPKGLRHA